MAIPKPQTREFLDQMAAVAAENRSELENTSQSLEEIALLINQTNSEVERLTQREVQFTNRVREMEANFDSFGRTDIRDVLRASHEVELRLFMMRGQLEQLQEREENIREYREKVRLLVEIADGQIEMEEERQKQDGRKTSRLRRRETRELGPTTPFEDLIKAQEVERGRMARKILDGPAQTLANIILEAEICERLIDRDIEQCREELTSLRGMASRALHDARRMLYELKPVTLGELGVAATLRRYLNDIQRALEIEGSVAGPDNDDNIPEAVRLALYRILQEMVGTGAAIERVERIDVDIRYEDAQIIGRVEITAPELDQIPALRTVADEEAVKERLEQLEADLQAELISEREVRLTLVIPLA
jgi:two-component system, NarL family, sensor histidine kinase DegS